MTLYNYEVSDQHGNKTTMQLTEEDAQRFPGAQQLGPAHDVQEADDDGDEAGDAGEAGDASAAAPVSTRTTGTDRVQNRARRQQ